MTAGAGEAQARSAARTGARAAMSAGAPCWSGVGGLSPDAERCAPPRSVRSVQGLHVARGAPVACVFILHGRTHLPDVTLETLGRGHSQFFVRRVRLSLVSPASGRLRLLSPVKLSSQCAHWGSGATGPGTRSGANGQVRLREWIYRPRERPPAAAPPAPASPFPARAPPRPPRKARRAQGNNICQQQHESWPRRPLSVLTPQCSSAAARAVLNENVLIRIPIIFIA